MVEWSDLTKSEQRKFGDGCGSGWFIAPFIAEFDLACREHDFEYERGGSLVDKIRSDVKFKGRLTVGASEAKGFWRMIALSILVRFYFRAVSIGGLFGPFKFGRYKNKTEILSAGGCK